MTELTSCPPGTFPHRVMGPAVGQWTVTCESFPQPIQRTDDMASLGSGRFTLQQRAATVPSAVIQHSIVGDVLGWVGDKVIPGSGTIIREIDKRLSGGDDFPGSGRSFNGGSGCTPPLVPDQSGICVFPGSPGDRSTGPSGTAVVKAGGSMVGNGMTPEIRTTTTRRCPRGMVLGTDNLCYRKGSIAKRDRKWVPGRKPLLTGGELNAIAKAERAARKMRTQQKRLQKLGLLPKPSRSRRSSPKRSSSSRTRAGEIIVVDTD